MSITGCVVIASPARCHRHAVATASERDRSRRITVVTSRACAGSAALVQAKRRVDQLRASAPRRTSAWRRAARSTGTPGSVRTRRPGSALRRSLDAPRRVAHPKGGLDQLRPPGPFRYRFRRGDPQGWRRAQLRGQLDRRLAARSGRSLSRQLDRQRAASARGPIARPAHHQREGAAPAQGSPGTPSAPASKGAKRSGSPDRSSGQRRRLLRPWRAPPAGSQSAPAGRAATQPVNMSGATPGRLARGAPAQPQPSGPLPARRSAGRRAVISTGWS